MIVPDFDDRDIALADFKQEMVVFVYGELLV
jgi:hypothetical protein